MTTKPTPLPRRIVAVTWKDITSQADWVGELEQVLEECNPILCVTVGWILKEDEEVMVLADSATKDRTFGGVTAIPKSVVVEIIDLRRESAHDFLKKSTLKECVRKRKKK
jgi:hypothetical protein